MCHAYLGSKACMTSTYCCVVGCAAGAAHAATPTVVMYKVEDQTWHRLAAVEVSSGLLQWRSLYDP